MHNNNNFTQKHANVLIGILEYS